MVAAKQTHSAPVQKITIVPRTSGALGYTMQVEEGDHYLMTKEEIENKIATFTGGRAAEEVVFGSVTTGASNDIEQATKLARAMITRYGMSGDFGIMIKKLRQIFFKKTEKSARKADCLLYRLAKEITSQNGENND